MTVELHPSLPKWAPVGAPVEIGWCLVNRGPTPIHVNRRCAAGNPGSGADISIRVFDVHGRLVPCQRTRVPPPAPGDFHLLPPSQSVYAIKMHDLVWDHTLPVGRYTVEMTYRVVDDVPPELYGEPVFTDMIQTDDRAFEVIHWGAPPPGKQPG